MADFGGPPVATGINPVGQGMQTLSDVMSFKQKQQALQTGQYTQQSAQANAQQDQQKNQELQSLAQFTKGAAQDPKYHNPDGSLNVQKYQTDAMAAAPTYGQEYIGQMTSNANAMVDNRKALLGLSNEQRKTIGGYFGAVAAKPNATKDDLMDAAEQARAVSDDPQYQRSVDRMLMATPDVRTMQTDQASAALRQHARGIAMETNAHDAATSEPTKDTMQGPNGLQGVNLNPMAPGGVGPQGPSMPQGLAPTEKLPYVRARGAAGVEGTAGAQNDEELYNTITQRGTQATKLKSLTQDIGALAGEVQTGQYSKAFADKWSALKQTFGFRPDDNSADTKRQILTKMAAQLKAQSESGATTDSARAGIEASLPDPEHMGPAAVSQAARYVGSLADIDAARARLAQQHRQVSGGQSTGLRAADSAFMQNADPKVFEYQNIPPGQERQAYLKQHFKSKEEVKAFLDKQQALRGYGAVQ